MINFDDVSTFLVLVSGGLVAYVLGRRHVERARGPTSPTGPQSLPVQLEGAWSAGVIATAQNSPVSSVAFRCSGRPDFYARLDRDLGGFLDPIPTAVTPEALQRLLAESRAKALPTVEPVKPGPDILAQAMRDAPDRFTRGREEERLRRMREAKTMPREAVAKIVWEIEPYVGRLIADPPTTAPNWDAYTDTAVQCVILTNEGPRELPAAGEDLWSQTVVANLLWYYGVFLPWKARVGG